jgi:hypothetical protein
MSVAEAMLARSLWVEAEILTNNRADEYREAFKLLLEKNTQKLSPCASEYLYLFLDERIYHMKNKAWRICPKNAAILEALDEMMQAPVMQDAQLEIKDQDRGEDGLYYKITVKWPEPAVKAARP